MDSTVELCQNFSLVRFLGVLAGKAFLMVLSSSSAKSLNTSLSAPSNRSLDTLLVSELLLVSSWPLKDFSDNFLQLLHLPCYG